MLIAVLADAHAHADALDAVFAAAEALDVDELWSLGDMVGRGPDPEHVVARTRERCRVALLGNHDYLALKPDATATPAIALARERLDEDAVAWMRSRKPAARRDFEPSARREREAPGARSPGCGPAGRVVAWHGGPHNAVHEFVGPRNAPSCLDAQRAPLGLVGHTHAPAAFHDSGRKVKIRPGEPLDISAGKWLLNPGAVGAPMPGPRLGWWAALDAQAAASWLLLDLAEQTATWQLTPFDPSPAHERVRLLGLDDG